MIYAKVGTMREAGLDAKWGRLRNKAPALFIRNPNGELKHQREKWWHFDRTMQKFMTEKGVVEGFNSCTLLGDMFSVPA